MDDNVEKSNEDLNTVPEVVINNPIVISSSLEVKSEVVNVSEDITPKTE